MTSWRISTLLALIVQGLAQLVFWVLLAPEYDAVEDGAAGALVAALVYFGISVTGGLLFSGKITIGMTLFAVAAALLLGVANWHIRAPISAFRDKLRHLAGR